MGEGAKRQEVKVWEVKVVAEIAVLRKIRIRLYRSIQETFLRERSLKNRCLKKDKINLYSRLKLFILDKVECHLNKIHHHICKGLIVTHN